ncbi:MAG: cytochrome c biogenesis protein CcdA [Candidatus Nanohaloarchaea archaeon]|nr:cytochrome c biogenesis protein CcdA [Candidatus Nanohaloarchaea archaeon]
MAAANLPTISAVVLTAAVDAVNPCAIGVALLLVATMIRQGRRRQMLTVGALYVAAVYATYFIAGVGILTFFVNIPVKIANIVTVLVSLLVITGGVLEVKDFFWYGKGTSLMIPEQYATRISERMEDLTAPAAVFLGAFVALVELPCTGGPYLAILTVIAQQGVNIWAYGLMALYNLIFVAPLIFIVVAAYLGMYSVSEMKQWKHMNRPRMRLAAGVLMVLLGWVLLVLATGIIRFG